MVLSEVAQRLMMMSGPGAKIASEPDITMGRPSSPNLPVRGRDRPALSNEEMVADLSFLFVFCALCIGAFGAFFEAISALS
jgi:hypothetical protein